jgi:C4-dicarboxylate-specific signal transduction histidine kinase
VAARQVGWAELPWLAMAAWALATGVALGSVMALRRQREQRLRAEELLRLGQVARLNTLGELAAGMAHELNQPLTAVLANTQAAQRLLADEPPDLRTASSAMAQAAQQARRAADVLGRLRRSVERPDPAAHLQTVALQDTVRSALHLLAPECARRQVEPQVQAPTLPVLVLAEPVALEQIVHNLLMNALQALDQTPPSERNLVLTLQSLNHQGMLTVADTGPGIAPELLPRVFEPFFSTRDKGLGLGLSLCETLAGNMGGSLTALHNTPRGALLTLSLPLAAQP